MSTNFIQTIPETQCIGDSLDTINNNYISLDTATTQLSTVILPKAVFNTLIQTLTSFGTTNYTSLSTSFRQLSSLIAL